MVLEPLKNYLRELSAEGIALAYSGGVDSTLLLAILGELNREKAFPLQALTMQTVLQSAAEIEDAKNLATEYGIKHKILTFNPFSLEEVKNNRTDRCYHCKKAIFSQFADYARQHGLQRILDGTNADDLNVYRPGRKALRELGVISPLAELGMTKEQIRAMSAELGLTTATKPAVPCLATRFEYNTLLDDEKIASVAKGEELFKKMFPEIPDIRLRVHGTLARIEVSKEFVPQISSSDIAEKLKKLGFDYVTLDLEGFRSGSFDGSLKN